MIGYLKGKVLDHSDGQLVLGVGADEGVGYEVMVPKRASLQWPLGSTQELFIYTHVRENILELYGFSSRGEKQIFLDLLSVNGIGPKGALTLLSKIEIPVLVDCILRKDKKSLISVPGIGKKTAERVVIELHDKVKKKMEAQVYAVPSMNTKETVSVPAIEEFNAMTEVIEEATQALVALGFRETQVIELVRKISQSNPDLKSELVVRSALQQIT